MDADYRRNSKRLRDEIAAEGGMQWDGRPEDMVRTRLRAFRQLAPRLCVRDLLLATQHS